MKLTRSFLLLLIFILGAFFVWRDELPTSVSTVHKPVTEQTESVIKTTEAKVALVTDGDTFTTTADVRVRVLGIDTPETKNAPGGAECYGDEASLRANELLSGETVSLTTDDSQDTYDDYGRLLAYVTLPDGQDYGTQMIEEGYAYEYTFIKPYQKQSLYRAVETTAKESEQGLWAVCQ